MNGEAIIAALDLPHGSRINQRVPKKLLIEKGAPTGADRRRINASIEDLRWLAALKPTTIGVPEYRDCAREYLEIAVLQLMLREGAKSARLIELVHRAVPYPVLLLTEQGCSTNVSAAHKRRAQNEAGKTVLDGSIAVAECNGDLNPRIANSFEHALSLSRQPRSTLFVLYQGWIDTLLALQAARITGEFSIPRNEQHATDRLLALDELSRLEIEIARLRTAAISQKQLSRRVELNLKLKLAESSCSAAKAKL